MGMSIDPQSDAVLTVGVFGQLTAAQWRAARKEAAERLRETADLSGVLVVVAPDFGGWERGSGEDWEDGPAPSLFDSKVERLAIVGERKWEDLVLMFVGKGLRRFEVEYFSPSELAEAKAWLTSKAAKATEGGSR